MEIAWSLLTDKSTWERWIPSILWGFQNISSISIMNYEAPGDLRCSVGNLVWQDDAIVMTKDFIHDAESSFSVSFPGLNQSYDMSSVAVNMRWTHHNYELKHNYNPMRLFHFESEDWPLTIAVGICDLNILQCDKVVLQHSEYLLLEKDEHRIVIEIRQFEYSVPIPSEDYLFLPDQQLAICSNILQESMRPALMSNMHEQAQGYLTLVGLILSICGLLVTVVIHFLFPSLRTIPGKTN